MKKLICIFLFATVFISCESDDGITYTTPDYISGQWNLKEVGEINNDSILVFQPYINDAGCGKDNLLLEPSNTFVETDFVASTTGCTTNILNGTYQLNVESRKLTLNYGQNDIAEFSVSQLFFDEMLLVAPNELGELIYFRFERNQEMED